MFVGNAERMRKSRRMSNGYVAQESTGRYTSGAVKRIAEIHMLVVGKWGHRGGLGTMGVGRRCRDRYK